MSALQPGRSTIRSVRQKSARPKTIPVSSTFRLKVHGVKGLRVADASVMPYFVFGNTNAPSIMIGARAAEFIKEETSVRNSLDRNSDASRRPSRSHCRERGSRPLIASNRLRIRFGLGQPQWRGLPALAAGEPLESRALAEGCVQMPSSVSRIMPDLVARGLVEPAESTDRRHKPWRVTPAAQAIIDDGRGQCRGRLSRNRGGLW
ncbi:GMC oxidoreductase [Ruegeria marina]|uniref:GMC oxidoreductase n=2 Tax=Ruegeria marina TaxID=639004 RepID=A0A1G7DKT5_9RHOB|nr:GMC oxidoreductase [Ruegeria marina]